MTTPRSSAGYNGNDLAPLQIYPTRFEIWNTEIEALERLLNKHTQLSYDQTDILYVGCGRRIPFEHCWCVDNDPNMGLGINNFVCADMLKLPFDAGRFALALSSHTLEHVSEDNCTTALLEQARVVKPRGLVGAIVPDRRWTAGADPTHIREWVHDEFVEAHKNLPGLELIDHSEAQHEYSFTVLWRRL